VRALGAALMVSLALAGCAGGAASGGLKLKKLDAVAQKPANVAVYFAVATKAGEPVADLQPASFRIFEDGKLVSEQKAKRALLDPRFAEVRFTQVLVDLSGPVVDGEDLPDLVSSVARFAEAASRVSQVAISVFDGEEDLAPMVGFGAQGGKAAIEAMRHYRPRGRSANLNGALMQGLDLLEKQLAGGSAPHRYGALVVFTDRGDLAHKVPAATVKKALAESAVDLYLVAAGTGVSQQEVAALAPAGRGSLFFSKEPKDFAKGFTETTRRLEAAAASRYVLSYCSNKRNGEHKLEIEVDTEEARGKLTHHFNADGFKSGCSPKHRPQFDAAE
jgi:hypothetical protein